MHDTGQSLTLENNICSHKENGIYVIYKTPSLNAEQNKEYEKDGFKLWDKDSIMLRKDRTFQELNDEEKKEIVEKKCYYCINGSTKKDNGSR
jgi:hypothetical protein